MYTFGPNTAQKLALFIISQARQTSTSRYCHGNHHRACNYPSDTIAEIRYFGRVRLLRPKQNKVLYVNMEYMDLLPPTAPSLVFARETCTPYCPTRWYGAATSIIRGQRLNDAEVGCNKRMRAMTHTCLGPSTLAQIEHN